MFKLFKKKDKSVVQPEAAQQLSVYQRKAFAFAGTAPGALPANVYEQMEGDSMVQCALSVKKLGVLASGWRIEGGEPAVVQFVKDAFNRMAGSPADVLRQAMDAFAKGWSVQETLYELDGDQIWLKAVHPKDPSLFGLDLDAYGNVRSLSLQMPGEKEERLPRGKFVLWANRASYGRAKGRSDLDAAYPHWSSKQSLLGAWRFHLERFAMPTLLGRFGPGLSTANQAELVNALKNLQENTSLVFPNDAEVTTLDISKEASTGFMDAIDFHNREMARAILGQTLTTDEGRRVGSLAMGKVHLQVLLLQLQVLRGELADLVMTEQIIRPLVQLNFGEVEIPRFVFEEVSLEAFTTGAI